MGGVGGMEVSGMWLRGGACVGSLAALRPCAKADLNSAEGLFFLWSHFLRSARKSVIPEHMEEQMVRRRVNGVKESDNTTKYGRSVISGVGLGFARGACSSSGGSDDQGVSVGKVVVSGGSVVFVVEDGGGVVEKRGVWDHDAGPTLWQKSQVKTRKRNIFLILDAKPSKNWEA